MVKRDSFIAKQIKKVEGEGWAYSVAKWVEDSLEDTDILFFTKQYIYYENGTLGCSDVYIPAYEYHLIVDKEQEIQNEAIRNESILYVSESMIKKINVSSGVIEARAQVNKLIEDMLKGPKKKVDIISRIATEKDVVSFIERGYLSTSDPIAFRIKEDAGKCLGTPIVPAIKGGHTHAHEEDVEIWWPSLFENNGWINIESVDGNEIVSRNIDPDKTESDLIETLKGTFKFKKDVFIKTKDTMGKDIYIFRGRFELDKEETERRGVAVYKKVSDTTKTYPMKK